MLACELGPQGEGREWTASNTATTLMRSYFIIDFTVDMNHMVLVAHINGTWSCRGSYITSSQKTTERIDSDIK